MRGRRTPQTQDPGTWHLAPVFACALATSDTHPVQTDSGTRNTDEKMVGWQFQLQARGDVARIVPGRRKPENALAGREAFVVASGVDLTLLHLQTGVAGRVMRTASRLAMV